MINDKVGLFDIKDIFKVVTGALLSKEKIEDGNIPRVTASSMNNGIAMFTDDIDHKNFRIFNNFISISFLGDVFYQPFKVSLDMKIHGLILKDKELNYDLAMFLIPMIKKFSKKYSYGYQLSSSVLEKQKIILPINDNGLPNWTYMENYISKKRNQNHKKKYKYLSKELDRIGEFKKVHHNECHWTEFKLTNIFDFIQRGKRLTKANQISGNIPYISSTSLNNGVDNFISDSMPIKKFRAFNNSITLANSGSVGSCFYHPYRYIGSDHITTLKSENLNEYEMLYLITSMKKIGVKYSFNREISDSRIINEKIMLPSTENGNPDYDFMENYVKGLIFKKIKKYLENMNEVK